MLVPAVVRVGVELRRLQLVNLGKRLFERVAVVHGEVHRTCRIGYALQLALVEGHAVCDHAVAAIAVAHEARGAPRRRADADAVDLHAHLRRRLRRVLRLHGAGVRDAVGKENHDLRLRLRVLQAQKRRREPVAYRRVRLVLSAYGVPLRVEHRLRYLDALEGVEQHVVVHRERRDGRGVGAERDEAYKIVRALLDELREKALHDGKTRPLLELLRGIPEVGASRREVERVHRAGDVDGHRDRNRVYRLLVVRERSAGTRRGDNEQGKTREEDERRERRELRAPSRRFRGEARCRGEPYPRAPAAPQQPPGGKAERQQQKKHQWSRKSHVYVISSPP